MKKDTPAKPAQASKAQASKAQTKTNFVPITDKKVGKPVNVKKEADCIVSKVTKAVEAKVKKDTEAETIVGAAKVVAKLPPKKPVSAVGKVAKAGTAKVAPKNPVIVEKKEVSPMIPRVGKKAPVAVPAAKPEKAHVPAFGVLSRSLEKARSAIVKSSQQPIQTASKVEEEAPLVTRAPVQTASTMIDHVSSRKSNLPAKKVIPVATGKVSFSDLMKSKQAAVDAVTPPPFDVSKYKK